MSENDQPAAATPVDVATDRQHPAVQVAAGLVMLVGLVALFTADGMFQGLGGFIVGYLMPRWSSARRGQA